LNVPEAKGMWAYKDDVDSDTKNRVKEDYSSNDWASRTRLRMLPVQLDDPGSGTNYSLKRVRLSIDSYSPTIPAPSSGGTYKARVEKVDTAAVDFHPVTPDNFVDLHPQFLAPFANQMCSSPNSTDLRLEWKHGPAATPDVVGAYHIRLYPEDCRNTRIPACSFPVPPIDPEDAINRTVERNDQPLQEVVLSRQELFPTLADEEKNRSGYIVQLYGVSGPVPGPAGLNITGTAQRDLPLLPAKFETSLKFFDDIDHPSYSQFAASSVTSLNPQHQPDFYSGQFDLPTHHIITSMFRGEGCHENELIDSTESVDFSNEVSVFLDDSVFEGEAHPEVSANVEMRWPDLMGCKVLKGDCISKRGTNRLARPKIPENLQAHDDAVTLGLSWDVPPADDPDTATIYYEVSIKIKNGDKPLAHPTGVVTRNFNQMDSFGWQIGVSGITFLEARDAGKPVTLEVRACRQGNNLCSAKATLAHVIGSSANGNPPSNVAFHFDDPGLTEIWKAIGVDIGDSENWIQVSFDPPVGAVPDYYLVTFTPTGHVPGILPTWLNGLNFPGVNYPGDAAQYTAAIRSSPNGVQFGSTPWGAYVWPLAETNTAGEPSAGQVLNVAVRACTGTPPISDPNLPFDWVVGPAINTCSVPAQASEQL
jgi:hypothetical protein